MCNHDVANDVVTSSSHAAALDAVQCSKDLSVSRGASQSRGHHSTFTGGDGPKVDKTDGFASAVAPAYHAPAYTRLCDEHELGTRGSQLERQLASRHRPGSCDGFCSGWVRGMLVNVDELEGRAGCREVNGLGGVAPGPRDVAGCLELDARHGRLPHRLCTHWLWAQLRHTCSPQA